MHSLSVVTVTDLLTAKHETAKLILSELRRDTTLEKAFEAPKMYLLAKSPAFGAKKLHKLLCFIVKDFQESLKITNKDNEMSASEIFDAADRLMGMNEGEYGRESVFDIIMAFKHFKRNPFDLYNAFNDERLTKIMVNYLTVKADFLERLNSRGKSEASQKEPLTLDQINREYELSQAGLPTNGDRINAERKAEDLKQPRNWRQDAVYRDMLAKRDWKKGYDVVDVPHEDVTHKPDAE